MPDFRRSAVSVVVLLLLLCVWPTAALQIKPTLSSLTFEVGKEEICLYSIGKDFFEGVSMHYHVLEGDDDFDVSIRDVNGRAIYTSYAGEHDLEDRIYFTTNSKIEHSYCIDNRDYSGSKKRIKMEIGLTSLKRWKDRIDPLRKLMRRTDSYLLGMHDDQILLRLKEQNLMSWVDKIYTMLVIRIFTESSIVVIVGLVNIIFISFLFKRANK